MNISLLLNEPSEEEFYLFSIESSPLKYASLTSDLDKFTIHKIASMLPAGSIVVEVGSYLGASAALMAHANENLEIHGYDLFDNIKYDKSHDRLVALSLGAGQPRSLENVSKFISRYKNIYLHKVAKNELIEFNQEIDLLIEDSSHREPQLSNSLNYWLPKVKITGILMMHDYRPHLPIDNFLRFPDVENYVKFLSNDRDWNFLGSIGSFAIFQRVSR
jgi:hypothetical protein